MNGSGLLLFTEAVSNQLLESVCRLDFVATVYRDEQFRAA
jgi:hypothetical protein